MKIRRFDELLRARGYKLIRTHRGNVVSENSYARIDVYEKQHTENKVECSVKFDTHGKAQTMNFYITSKKLFGHDNFEGFKIAEFDRSYLAKEAEKIHDAFEQLKQMKAPKHIYF